MYIEQVKGQEVGRRVGRQARRKEREGSVEDSFSVGGDVYVGGVGEEVGGHV